MDEVGTLVLSFISFNHKLALLFLIILLNTFVKWKKQQQQLLFTKLTKKVKYFQSNTC